jgi:DNA-damage-inducible protein J
VSKPAAPKNAPVHAEVDSHVLKRATQTLQELGLTVPDAIRLMLQYVALEQTFPLDFMTPNAETRAAMVAARRGKVDRFNSIEELMADLNAED